MASRKQSNASGESAPAMLRYEQELPTLPVPTLVETAAKWLDSVKPFAAGPESSTQTVAGADPKTEAFQRAQQASDDFVASPLVRELQKRLKQRAETTDSWLSEWWNETAYFGYRGPVVPGVNCPHFYSHRDDKARRTGPARAASLIRSLLHFRRLVETGVLEPEMVRQTPLAMKSYEYLFNATRYPAKGCDTAEKFDANAPENQHIVVIRRNKFYEVRVVSESGEIMSEADLEVQFKRIVEMAGTEADPNPVGALTTENRDVWADALAELRAVSSGNAKSLDRIHRAIVVLVLDDTKPVTRSAVSWALWVGDGRNRFFDKHEVIVFDNGKSGFNGEHSCMDGTPTSRLNDWMLRSIAAQKIPAGSATQPSNIPKPIALPFEHNEKTKQSIVAAQKQFEATMAPHELKVLNYEAYGKNKIKTFKVSPDSWAQLCMQLAYYRMTGELAPTYESAQTRKYKLGRTEVIRSATAEVLDWCRAMENHGTPPVRKLELLRRAVNAHSKYAAMAADGRGVDRHFFGLKKCLKEGEQLPVIYSDPLFSHSCNWVMSTSQLTSEFFDGWGFGEVVDEGFGIGYAIMNDSMRFTITCQIAGNASLLRHYIAEACSEVRETMEAAVHDESSGLGRAGKL